jgi:hypothetical protein
MKLPPHRQRVWRLLVTRVSRPRLEGVTGGAAGAENQPSGRPKSAPSKPQQVGDALKGECVNLQEERDSRLEAAGAPVGISECGAESPIAGSNPPSW